MAFEWKRASWTYDAIGLGHTNVNICNAIQAFLVDCGWERAAWDTATDRFFLRTDRLTVLLENNLVGTAGNVAITKTDPNSRLTIAGMSGGTVSVKATGTVALSPLGVFDADRFILNDGVNPAVTFEFEAGAAVARGRVSLLAQPADGNTVVINDGVNPAVTFEFDSNSSVVQSNTLRQVVIGASVGATITNLSNAINAAPVLDVTGNVGVSDSVTLANDTAGTGGNVTITSVGGNIFTQGMTGGGGGAGVTGGAVAVTRGATVEETIVNLVTAINAAPSLNITARWANRWAFNGDGVWQHCGIEVFNDTVNSRIVLRSFLQKPSGIGSQVATQSVQEIRIVYSQTAPNIFQFFGGEYGFFGECGRDGQRVNLAHWAITTFEAMPELFGTDDARVTWTTQGITLDLFGQLKFALNRNYRFVDAANGNRNFTSGLQPSMARGTNNFDSSTQADNRASAIGPMDLVLGASPRGPNWQVHAQTFGMFLSPRDGRYRISPLLVRQFHPDYVDAGNTTNSVSNNLAPSAFTDGCLFWDVRRWRKMTKFAVVDASLIPFVNVVDQVTGIEYYITQIQDNGRPANLCVEWTSVVVSIAATP